MLVCLVPMTVSFAVASGSQSCSVLLQMCSPVARSVPCMGVGFLPSPSATETAMPSTMPHRVPVTSSGPSMPLEYASSSQTSVNHDVSISSGASGSGVAGAVG